MHGLLLFSFVAVADARHDVNGLVEEGVKLEECVE